MKLKIEETQGNTSLRRNKRKLTESQKHERKKSLEHITLTSRKCEPLSHERNCFFLFSFNLALYVSRHIVDEKIMLFKP